MSEQHSGCCGSALSHGRCFSLWCQFYLIQALQIDSGSPFYCWTRWGRVGERGQSSLAQCANAAAAKSAFEKKFREKTSNQWSDRGNFRAVAGKYTLIERDYSADSDVEGGGEDEKTTEDAEDGTGKEDRKEKQSELDDRVQELVRLICDVGQRTDIERSNAARSHCASPPPATQLLLYRLCLSCVLRVRYDEEADDRDRIRRVASATGQAQ